MLKIETNNNIFRYWNIETTSRYQRWFAFQNRNKNFSSDSTLIHDVHDVDSPVNKCWNASWGSFISAYHVGGVEFTARHSATPSWCNSSFLHLTLRAFYIGPNPKSKHTLINIKHHFKCLRSPKKGHRPHVNCFSTISVPNLQIWRPLHDNPGYQHIRFPFRCRFVNIEH